MGTRLDRFDNFKFSQMRYSRIETSSYKYDDVLRSTLVTYSNSYTSNLYEDFYEMNSKYVDWTCFECKTSIKVNVEKLMSGEDFDQRQLFCESHRPHKTNRAYKNNYIFQKYFVAFNNYVKNIVLENSKLSELSAWKELQNSGLTFQLTQPVSSSSYQKTKKTKKKRSSFRSVLENQKYQDQ